MTAGTQSRSPTVRKVLAAFDKAREDGLSDKEAFEAGLKAAPPHWKRRTVANMIYNHLGKPTWADPAYRELVGGEERRTTIFALTDEAEKSVFIGLTAQPFTTRVSALLSDARQFSWGRSFCAEGPCEWILSVWEAHHAISVFKLEELETFIPHFSRRRRHFMIGGSGWLGPQPSFVWSYVALRAGYKFALPNWYEKFIPEDRVCRPDVLAMVEARAWPAEPVRVVWD